MKKRILLAITVAIISFIFLNSALPADTSSQESGFILDIINAVSGFLGLPFDATEHLVRKLAHFTEFAALGFFLSWTVREFAGKLRGHVFMILFFLCAVPLADETIQYFSPGRSAEVKDVLLDFSGAVFGFLLIAAASALSKKKCGKTSEK